MSYEQRVKERIVKSLPERFRYGCYRGKAYPHICIEKDYNFIDRVAQKWNVLKGNLKPILRLFYCLSRFEKISEMSKNDLCYTLLCRCATRTESIS